jgi:hypothetical protein
VYVRSRSALSKENFHFEVIDEDKVSTQGGVRIVRICRRLSQLSLRVRLTSCSTVFCVIDGRTSSETHVSAAAHVEQGGSVPVEAKSQEPWKFVRNFER